MIPALRSKPARKAFHYMTEPRLIASFDLSTFAAQLGETDRHRTFKKMVGQVAAAASAHKDFVEAKAAMTELGQRTKHLKIGQSPKAAAAIIMSALFGHAIILYARATSTESAERFGWFGIEKLKPDSRTWHEEISRHRNSVLAHFGKAVDDPDGAAVREAVIFNFFMLDDQELSRIDFNDERVPMRGKLAIKLDILLDEVTLLCRAAYDKRSEAMLRELDRLCEEDPSLMAALFRHPYDPTVFYQGRATSEVMSGMSDSTSHHIRATDVGFIKSLDTFD